MAKLNRPIRRPSSVPSMPPPSETADQRYIRKRNEEALNALPAGNIVQLVAKPRRPGEAVTDTATRFAADDERLDNLIKSLSADLEREAADDLVVDSLVAEGMDYLPRRRAQLEALGMPKLSSGEPLAGRLDKIVKMEDRLMNLGVLEGGIPAPLRTRVPSRLDGERRRHTQYEVSPITGQQNVIPFMDPDNPSKPVITDLGLLKRDQIPGGHDNASEHIGENVLKLMGQRGEMNRPHDWSGRPMYEAADLQSGPKDDPYFYDVETFDPSRDKGNEVQMYTMVDLARRHPASSKDVRQRIVEMEKMVTDRAARKNLSIEDAVEDLIADNLLFGFNKRAGKILKGEMGGMWQGKYRPGASSEEGMMDGIIKLGEERSDRNKAMKHSYREGVRKIPYAIAPTEIQLVDIPKAREDLAGVTGEDVAGTFGIRPNRIGSHEKGRLYASLPDSSEAVRDLADEFVYTRQLLKHLPLI